jgi:hypothetical protein
MNEEALFQEYSTNRALQATYPDFATYRDFVMSQMPAQANDNSGLTGIINNAASSMGTMKDLGKNLIMNKLTSKMGLGLNPIGIGGLVLSGLSGINDRIRQTDFARSKTLADYLDAKSYGGIDARNAAAVANMAQARGLQKQMAQRPSSQVSAQDAARGRGGGGGHAGGSAAAAGAAAQAADDAAAGAGGY